MFFAFDRSGSSFDVLGSFDFYVDHAEAFCILHSVVLSLDPLDPLDPR